MIRIAVVALALAAATSAGADTRGYELRNAEARRPAPLVVVLHCYGCPPESLPKQWKLDALAKQYGFVMAVPAGMRDHHGYPFWNATPACCDFDDKKPDDVGYVMGVIDELVKKGVADPKRVYLAGFSNGGFLAYRLACEHADRIAAIVSVGGGAPETCTPSSAVSVLDVHGESDDTVPASGRVLGHGFPRRGGFPAAREALARFAAVDHCLSDKGGGWRCPHNAVELWMLPGGHVPSYGEDFSERLWKWLAAQHK